MIAADLATTIGDTAGSWAYLVIGALTGLEAAAFVGLFIPGETTLILAGYLIHRGELDPTAVITVAIAGAVIGDSVGYEIGRRYGPRLRTSRLGRRIGDGTWDRAHEQIRRHGPRSVLIGRFVGVLRAVVPAAVGDARMPYRRFITWNLVGAIVWVPSVVLIGVVAGESYEQVASAIGSATTGLALVGLAIAVLAWRRRRRAARSNPAAPATPMAGEPVEGAPRSTEPRGPGFDDDPQDVLGRIFVSASLERVLLRRRFGEPAAQALDGVQLQLLVAMGAAHHWSTRAVDEPTEATTSGIRDTAVTHDDPKRWKATADNR